MVEDGLSQWSQKKWTIQHTLPVLHSRFGVSLFFEIHVIDRPSPPFGKIIAISEGELGLPHKDLYSVDSGSKVRLLASFCCLWFCFFLLISLITLSVCLHY